MAKTNKYVHFNTRAAFDKKCPNPSAAEGNEFYYYTVFIKDTGEIYTHGKFYGQNYFELTYDEIKSLRDSGKLIPGAKYRMIDYVTTTNPTATTYKSAGKAFDILLTATSTNMFSANVDALAPTNVSLEWAPIDLSAFHFNTPMYILYTDNICPPEADDPWDYRPDYDDVYVPIGDGNALIDIYGDVANDFFMSNLLYPENIIVMQCWTNATEETGVPFVEGAPEVHNHRPISLYALFDLERYNWCVNNEPIVNNQEDTNCALYMFMVNSTGAGAYLNSNKIFHWPEQIDETWFRQTKSLQNCDYNKWQIWYDLDNISNYSWSNADGKGVIYRMIDEYGNDCPYDFKNIIMKNQLEGNDQNFYYTFNYNNNGINQDYSCTGNVFSNTIDLRHNSKVFNANIGWNIFNLENGKFCRDNVICDSAINFIENTTSNCYNLYLRRCEQSTFTECYHLDADYCKQNNCCSSRGVKIRSVESCEIFSSLALIVESCVDTSLTNMQSCRIYECDSLTLENGQESIYEFSSNMNLTSSHRFCIFKMCKHVNFVPDDTSVQIKRVDVLSINNKNDEVILTTQLNNYMVRENSNGDVKSFVIADLIA